MKKIVLLSAFLMPMVACAWTFKPKLSNESLKRGSSFIGKTVVSACIYGTFGYFALKKGVNHLIDLQKGEPFKVYEPGEIKENFTSVVGYSREKKLFQDIVQYLKDPSKYQAVGAEPNKGILLSGAPGVGKTLLVRALAGEAQCPFIYASGADLSDVARVKRLFEQATALSKPCIIFLDEFEFLALSREKNSNSQVIPLLTELDGFIKKQTHPIIVIAATNFPDKLDPALLRSGRLSHHIKMEAPTVSDRKSIFQFYLNKTVHDKNIDLTSIVYRTQSYTGAQIAETVQSAARNAVNNGRSCVTHQDLEVVLDTDQIGTVNDTITMTSMARKVAAYHEAGHALACMLMGRNNVSKITIQPRGQAGGFTSFINPNHEKIHYETKEDYLSEIIVGFGGRAAEEIIFNIVSSGPSSDLQGVTSIAEIMVKKLAMNDGFAVEVEKYKLDEKVTHKQINNILDVQYKKTLKLLKTNIHMLHDLAQELLEKGTLHTADIERFMEKHKLQKAVVLD